jgi:hypothetical protein
MSIRHMIIPLLACAGMASAAMTLGPTRLDPAPTSPKPAEESMSPECVLGFSKDYCNGIVYPGESQVTGCPSVPANCRTLRIFGATYVISVFSNNQVCGGAHTETCDEVKDGRLKVSSDFTIRLQKHCPYRGCWDGTYAEFTDPNGTVFAGRLMGTMGVGTHRRSTTPSFCAQNPGTRDCEKCWDVESLGDVWRIGYEANFHGRSDQGEELCFSLSGDFYIRGSAQTGPIWDSEWSVAGTADGVKIAFCP